MNLHRLFLALTFCLVPWLAWAQGGQVLQSGSITPHHPARWVTSGVIGDGGGAAGATDQGGNYLSELGITNTGTPFCINDSLISSTSGYHQFCLGANSLGGGLLSYNAYGGAPSLPLNCMINGVFVPNCFNGGGGGGTGCIVNAVAGGTGDAITIPALPCAANATVLTLTITASNSTVTPTLTPAGGTSQVILAGDGTPLCIGDLVPGMHLLLTNNGVNWIAPIASHTVGAPQVFDPRSFGATCSSADSTSAIQQTVNAALLNGGTVIVPCPMTIAGQVNVGANGTQGGVRITGTGPMYMPLQNVNPSGPIGGGSGTVTWPPTVGSALNCTGTSVTSCLMVNGAGVEIDHINFGNVQPTPPTSGTWSPTVYPFIIATQSNTGWQGLNLHHLTFTSTSNAIDLEGTPDYTTYAGAAIRISDIWCNACLNTGIRIHDIDNSQLYSNIDFVPSGYYFSYAPVGAYMRANSIGIDIQYAAAPQFSNLNFFTHKSAIQVRNGTVTNNFGTLNFALSAGQFTNVMFNQSCQAVTMPNGNGTVAEFYMTNVYVWGDQSSFACSKGKAMFDLPSNDTRMLMSMVGDNISDTFVNIGCGAPGTGSCPSGGPGGGAWLRLMGIRADNYSAFSSGQNFINAPSGTQITFQPGDEGGIIGASGAGVLIGPGLDGTQAYETPINVGGGTVPTDGAVQLQGGQNTGGSGFATFFTIDHSERGYVGGCDGPGPTMGCTLAAGNGTVYLKPAYLATGSQIMSFGTSGGKSIVNLGSLPTICTGQPTGTLWSNGGVLNVCP